MKKFFALVISLLAFACSNDDNSSSHIASSGYGYQKVLECNANNGKVVIDSYTVQEDVYYGKPETRYQVVLTGALARSAGAKGIIHNKNSDENDKLIIQSLHSFRNSNKFDTRKSEFISYPMTWSVQVTNGTIKITQIDRQPQDGDLGTVIWEHSCI